MSLLPQPTHLRMAFGSGHLILDPWPHLEMNSVSPGTAATGALRPLQEHHRQKPGAGAAHNPTRPCIARKAEHAEQSVATGATGAMGEGWDTGPCSAAFSALTVAKGCTGLRASELSGKARGFCPQDRMMSATAQASTLTQSPLLPSTLQV